MLCEKAVHNQALNKWIPVVAVSSFTALNACVYVQPIVTSGHIPLRFHTVDVSSAFEVGNFQG